MTSMDRRGFVAAAGAATAAVALNPQTAQAYSGQLHAGAVSATRTDGLPHDDRQDFKDADRGFIAAFTGGAIKNKAGATIWDTDAYAFLSKAGDTPPKSVDKSLWRQARLVARQGLYKVTERIYQVRGLDISNMTIVEGETGVIVIDPLISAETAAAALALYRAHRGNRAVKGMIYTHPHLDHFGGCRGVLPDGGPGIPVLAPRGFMEHAVSENVYAGPAMVRRASYMYGTLLPKGADVQVGCGLGLTVSDGTVNLIPPTQYISATGQEVTVDGVRIQFQMTPGTECQEEMNFLFPDLRAVCMAENATHTMHNIITLRGAQVRDAHAWAGYLTEAISLYGGKADVAFASHHWPTWGNDSIVELLGQQRDLYGYLHDQTVRLMNKGMTGSEIAETLRLPPALERAWAVRGYYGSVSHNVKGIYQRYMGWFDGNPANLWRHPPVEEARRYVACMGGQGAVRSRAEQYARKGDLRFAVTLLNHAVFNDPKDTRAKRQLAEVYTRLGHASENAVWRNFYLTGAQELTKGVGKAKGQAFGPDVYASLTIGQLIDGMAVRINGPKAWGLKLAVDWHIGDDYWHLVLTNGVLTWTSGTKPGPAAGLTMTMTRDQLLVMLLTKSTKGITMTGNPLLLVTLMAVLDEPDMHFAIVTP
ncbi:alkyl sulfatase dimerization domain-containing protein [Streptomyces sp. SCSIO 30461]|uniref:alkyl/aryl-sulfatase n=1 Tax=Streptomyces sp. SCSIO 30461 TaxID=3118085 RepID=UPI0030D1CCAE